MFVSNIITWFALALMLIARNYNVLILCAFILGAGGITRVQIAALYLYESLSKANFQKVFTVFAALEGALNLFTAIYF